MSCALTRLLRDACGGAARTAVLVTLSPRPADRKTTLHSLQFAQSVARLHKTTDFAMPAAPRSVVTLFGLEQGEGGELVATPSARGGNNEQGATSPRTRAISLEATPLHPTVRRWAALRAYVCLSVHVATCCR